MNETMTISKVDYEEMQDALVFLNCLRNAGVDNWDGYDSALEEYREYKGDDE